VKTGRVLKKARRRAGLTQRRLGELAGVPQSTVARIESGAIDARATTLARLLRSCGFDLEALPRPGAGVDRSQIRERLARSPRERLEDLAAAAAAMERIRGRAQKVS
jgi:transcriptional regulator with XRE-family HTH domain